MLELQWHMDFEIVIDIEFVLVVRWARIASDEVGRHFGTGWRRNLICMICDLSCV